MASKIELIHKVLYELRRAQIEPWKPPSPGKVKELRLPPGLPLSDGRQISATDELLDAVSDYSNLILANDQALKSRFKNAELYQLAAKSFAEILQSVDLDKTNTELCDTVKSDVDAKLQEMTARHRQTIQLTLGCNVFQGDAAYPITIGPVMFETREQWRLRSEGDGKLTAVTARRLEAKWAGKILKVRKTSYDSLNEGAVLDTIGNCPTVCTISTDGLSSILIKEKGLLVARLAMTAISLIWTNPSQGLSWMHLYYDGRVYGRHYVLFGEKGYAGSSSATSQHPFGRWTDDDMISYLKSYQWLFDQVGEALYNYVQPAKSAARPNIMNALFLSLWWFYEACREPSDQMATTKFAASMDALSGGRKAKGIINFIEARLGVSANKSIMKDGRTVKKVVAEFYDAGRSRMIHGSSDNFAHDWSEVRSAAESVGRHCLTAASDWLAKNPASDDVGALSQP